MGLEDIDYNCPPHGKLFDHFQMTQAQAPPPRATTMLAPDIPMAANPFTNAFAAIMMGMAGLTQPPIGGFTNPPPTKKDGVEDSCDTSITYPVIDTFLHQIMNEHPNRNLEGLAEQLMAQDFYCIDELQDEDETFFWVEPYTLSQGNAKFVFRKLRDAVWQAKEVAR